MILTRRVCNHALNHLKLLEEKWETTEISRSQVEQILQQINNVTDKLAAAIKNAHERIIGERQVANKDEILSLYEHDIFNAVCPRNPSLLAERLKENEFREAQNRRSQTEARISILSNCFCGSPMKPKGFDNRHIHMGLSILSHNLWVLARLKIAQEKTRQQAA